MLIATIRYLIYLTPDRVKDVLGMVLTATMFATTVCGIMILS